MNGRMQLVFGDNAAAALAGPRPEETTDRLGPVHAGPMIWSPESTVAAGQGRGRSSGTVHLGLSVRWSTSFAYGHWVQGG
jgi:hypothetical protein